MSSRGPRMGDATELEGSEYVVPLTATAVAVSAGKQGNMIENRKPVEAAMALEMLAEGKTYDEVEAATGIGYSALAGLKTRHPETLEKRRQQMAKDGFELAEALRLLALKKARMLADDEDQLKKVNLRDIVLPFAISQDKGFAAMGENTVKVEHTTKKLSIEDARKLIEEARRQVQVDEIPVVAEVVAEAKGTE